MTVEGITFVTMAWDVMLNALVSQDGKVKYVCLQVVSANSSAIVLGESTHT